MSEPEGYNDDCENRNTTIGTIEENSNDENDVDDETMSGKHTYFISFELTLLSQFQGSYLIE
jgi:tripartite motif-containing protein 37